MGRTRSYETNQGLVNVPDVADDVIIAGVIVVTMNADGSFGTFFQAEDLDEIPTPTIQLDLGQRIADAWAAAQLAHVDESED